MPRPRTTFWADFKRFFFRGLAVLLPSVLTLWIIVQLYYFVDAQVAAPINRGIREAITWIVPQLSPSSQPQWYQVTPQELADFKAALARQGTLDARALLNSGDAAILSEIRRVEFARFWDAHWYFRFIGLFVAVILFYLAGLLFGGLVGRAIYEALERFLTRIPLVKQVYPHVKQLVNLVLGERQVAFRKVVLVEYPRKGAWSVAFVTSSGMRDVSRLTGEDTLTVFVPSTPTPFTGFTMTVRRSEAVDLPISVDEAVRFLLTGGVLIPERQSTDRGRTVPLPASPAVHGPAGGAAPGGGTIGDTPGFPLAVPPARPSPDPGLQSPPSPPGVGGRPDRAV